ncbi:MAG: hypothetical protein ACYDA4_17240 [Ignavibacteriaceae bacterium]
MERIINSFFLIFTILFYTAEVNAQWVQTNGPYGGHTTALAVDSNNVIYQGTNSGGIFTSTNMGRAGKIYYRRFLLAQLQ